MIKIISPVYFSGVLIVVLALFVVGCGGSGPLLGSTPQPTSLPPVRALSGAVAEASVVPVRFVTLSFVRNGIVEEILVQEGEQAAEGAVLAWMRGREQQQALISRASVELLSATQTLDSLYENYPKIKAEAELRLADAEKALDDAFRNLENKKNRRGTREQIRLAQAEYILAQDRMEHSEEVFAGKGNLAEDDLNRAAALTVLGDALKTLDFIEAKLNNLQENPSEFELGVAKAQYDLAAKEKEAAELDLSKLVNGPDPDLIRLTELQITNAEAQLNAARVGLNDLELVAPFAATVVSSDLKPGEQVVPGVSQVVLADLSEWQVETTDLTELNIVNIKMGSPVIVNFDALPSLEINGKVKSIQSLGKNIQGDITYKITIALDKQDENLRWNMTSTVVFED